jgi:hypothetical protein
MLFPDIERIMAPDWASMDKIMAPGSFHDDNDQAS